MATYTSNYNLEKPDSSDQFGDFRASYNSNMDIIDANLGGGGGGGGHTIIDPNGSDMAQRTGLQFTGSCSVSDDAVNDKTVVNISGGGGSVDYSTNEQVIGTWFGKPLYHKTIVKNNIAMGNYNGTLTSVAHGVANLKECVRLNMSCPILGYCTGDNLTSTAGVVIATFRVDGTNVYCAGGNNYFGATNDRYWYFTIQYTKTTD